LNLQNKNKKPVTVGAITGKTWQMNFQKEPFTGDSYRPSSGKRYEKKIT
jgi:hypothetical protein